MDKLNYTLLDRLLDTPEGVGLEVTDIDVKRLRDDRSEIEFGQDIAFVATGSFRLTHAGRDILGRIQAFNDVAVGTELFAIGPDAELRSQAIAIDEDSVALWLADRYGFKFTLNGKDSDLFHEVGQVRLRTKVPGPHHEPDAPVALPWIRKLNTAVVKDDYIDVDVVIDEPDTGPPVPPPSTTQRWSLADGIAFPPPPPNNPEPTSPFELSIAVELGSDTLEQLATQRRELRVAVPTDDPSVQLTFVILVKEAAKPTTAKHTSGAADPAAATSPKRKP
jgi:hypothetical protein